MSVNESCYPNPAATFMGDPFGINSKKRLDGFCNCVWLITALALTIIGVLSLMGSLPFGMAMGSILTFVGGSALVLFVIAGCISSIFRGACIVGMTIAHQD